MTQEQKEAACAKFEADRRAFIIRVMDDPDFWYGDHFWKPGNPGNPFRTRKAQKEIE